MYHYNAELDCHYVPKLTQLMYDKKLKLLRDKNDPEINKFLNSLDKVNKDIDSKIDKLSKRKADYEKAYSTDYYDEKGTFR